VRRTPLRGRWARLYTLLDTRSTHQWHCSVLRHRTAIATSRHHCWPLPRPVEVVAWLRQRLVRRKSPRKCHCRVKSVFHTIGRWQNATWCEAYVSPIHVTSPIREPCNQHAHTARHTALARSLVTPYCRACSGPQPSDMLAVTPIRTSPKDQLEGRYDQQTVARRRLPAPSCRSTCWKRPSVARGRGHTRRHRRAWDTVGERVTPWAPSSISCGAVVKSRVCAPRISSASTATSHTVRSTSPMCTSLC
jgi:hypothetical protein